MMKVTFLEPLGIPQEQLKAMVESSLGELVEATYYDTRAEDAETLTERSKGADCVVLSNIRYGEDIISQLPDLKMICVAFTGVDLIDVEYCRSKGIMVCNCAGYSTAAVADLVFGMLIALYRNLIPCNEVVRHEGTKDGLVGMELEGKKFGVIGTGAIGMRTARIAQAFGCEVLAWSRTKKDMPQVAYMPLEELLAACDIISLHVPLTEETRGLIGEKELALMKESAVLINTARGPVVDSNALAEALQSGKIAGAAVDVFETEPPVASDHPLLQAKNLIATPHVAFATKEAMVKRAHTVFENVKAWETGKAQNVI